MRQLRHLLIISGLFVCSQSLRAQEFPKGWVLYGEGLQGISTNFGAAPDLYTGSLELSPMTTVVESHLRLGGVAGLLFTNKKLDGIFGPRLAWKLKDFTVSEFGSVANLQLQLEAIWGTSNQRLIGGGPKLEIAKFVTIGITAHRDYHLNDWWFRLGVGYNFLHKKRSSTPHDPFDPNKK